MSAEQTLDRTAIPPESVDPGDTQALILRTAAALFFQHGYAAVSMSQIVEEVSKVRKLSKPAIYYHFADKEALFMAVLLEAMEEGGRAITAASATEGDLTARVVALARIFPRGHGFILNFRAAISAFDGEARERFTQARNTLLSAPLVAAFEEFAARGELRPGIAPATAALALMGITHMLAVSEMKAGIDGDVAALAADILLNGIAASEGGCRGPAEPDPDG
jgi:AcrR family transcriptional regulator